jgi:hypothetical protein
MDRRQLTALFTVLGAAVLLALALLSSPGKAKAQSAGYSFVGGTARQQATVRNALDASSFDWNLVPGAVTIHIAKGVSGSYSTKGNIWLEPALLTHGAKAWGVIQHEYAHQIDFFLFDSTIRARLTKLLGAKTWWAGQSSLRHSQLGCERFASTLAWAYWPSRQNTLIRFAHAEATAMPPAKFRRLLDNLLAHA